MRTNGNVVRRKKFQAVAAAACGLFAGAGMLSFAPAAHADNNSTAILPSDKFRIETILEGADVQTNGHTAIGLMYGIGPDRSGIFGRTEFGFDYVLSAGPFAGAAIPPSTDPTTHGVGFGGAAGSIRTGDRLYYSLKTQLYDNPKSGVRVAAGGYLFGADRAEAGDLSFLSISKQTAKYGYFQTGVVRSYASRRVLAAPDGQHDRDYIQLDYAYQLLPRLVGGFNYYTGKSRNSVFFPAIIYFLNNTYDTSVTVGDFHFNDSSIRPRQDQLYVQIDIYFDRKPKQMSRPVPTTPAAEPAPKTPGSPTPDHSGGTTPAPATTTTTGTASTNTTGTTNTTAPATAAGS